MAEKFNPDAKLSPQELAKHLRQPYGDIGKGIGNMMNKGNKHICLNSYKVLQPLAGNHILEIGMGNGLFIKELLEMTDSLRYTGADFSSTMVEEAQTLNKAFIEVGNVSFKEASIDALPFENDSFDCITTTNTLYFWPQPLENCKELLRVLKPNGKLLIAYRDKNFMDKVEFTNYGFTKYEVGDVEALLLNGGFSQISTEMIKEPELEFEGKPFQMEGYYTIGIKA